MAYYFNKVLRMSFDEAIRRVREELVAHGFGVLTDIDVRETLQKKLDIPFREYRILGACNPQIAYEALSVEDKIGTMMPCNVIVQALDDGGVEVAAIDPIASMMAVDQPALAPKAELMRDKLRAVIESL